MSKEAPSPISEQLLKSWSKLRLAKYRRASGLLLAEGSKVVRELLASKTEAAAILCTEAAWDDHKIVLETSPAPCYRLNARQFAKIAQDSTPEGVLAVVHTPFRKPADLTPAQLGGRALLLHQVGDPGNLGAILRSALWFGFETVIIGGGSVEAGNHKVVKASMGALFHLHIYEGVDLAKFIAGWNYENQNDVNRSDSRTIIALTLMGETSLPLAIGDKVNTIALLLGGEAHGLPAELAKLVQHRWRIPGTGRFDSLSLPQAAAVAMYAYARREEQ